MTTHPPRADRGEAPEAVAFTLSEYHRALEALARELLARTYEDDSYDLVVAYRRFEHEVLEHLASEEDLLLPAYAEVAPTEAAAFRREHAEIRQVLERIGLDVELHVVRAEIIATFIRALQAHAAREDALLYPWAEEHLPEDARRALFHRLDASRRELAELQARHPTVAPPAPA